MKPFTRNDLQEFKKIFDWEKPILIGDVWELMKKKNRDRGLPKYYKRDCKTRWLQLFELWAFLDTSKSFQSIIEDSGWTKVTGKEYRYDEKIAESEDHFLSSTKADDLMIFLRDIFITNNK